MLAKDKISELVNVFCKMMVKDDNYDPSVADDFKIVLEHGEGYWELRIIPAEQKVKRGDYALVLDFPKPMPEDPIDAAIELAGFLSVRLNRYAINAKASANRSAEVRKASAKKAVEARWRKQNDNSKQP